jgi:(S)-2-hydroxy-acid oxidase
MSHQNKQRYFLLRIWRARDLKGYLKKCEVSSIQCTLRPHVLLQIHPSTISHVPLSRRSTFQSCFPAPFIYNDYLTSTPLEFYNSGSTDQHTITANSASLNRLLLRSRVLVDVSSNSTASTLWGEKVTFPLGVAPAGIQAMAHPDGELATSRACAKANVPMAVSSFSNYSIEDIRAAGPGTSHAMQLYTMRDRALQERIVRRAEAAGCKAIFLTADSPVIGVRYNEWRNDFRTPPGLNYPNLEWDSENIRTTSHDSAFHSFNDDGHSWERDIKWLRARTGMEIWIKGVICGEDVERAVEAGCDGVIVCSRPPLW